MKKRSYLICTIVIAMLLLFSVGCSEKQKQGEIIIKGSASKELITAVAQSAIGVTGMNYKVVLHTTKALFDKELSTEVHLIPEQNRTTYMFGGNGYVKK